MAKVQIKIETGNLLHFSHPNGMGLVFITIALGHLAISTLDIFSASGIIFKALSAFFFAFGVSWWSYRFDARFFPNTRTYQIKHGIWPLLSFKEGPYDELIGVVLSKVERRNWQGLWTTKRSLWEASFALTSIDQPFCYYSAYDENEVRYQLERFAKHFQTKMFDRTDPINIIEKNWNELAEGHDEKTITQTLAKFDFGDPPKGLGLEHGKEGFRVELPLQGHKFRFTLTVLSGLFLILLDLFYYLSFSHNNELLTHSLPLFLFALTLGVVALIAGTIGFFGKTRLMCYKGKVHSEIVFLSIPMWERTLPIRKVENIRIIEIPKKQSLSEKISRNKIKDETCFQLVIDADYQRIRFAEYNDRETLVWIRMALVSTIFERDKAA